MKRKFQPFIYIAIIALLFSACDAKTSKTEAVDLDKVKVEIQAMEDAYAAGEKAKNADAVAAYYSDDAITYGPNRPPTKGRAAIKDSIAARLARDTSGSTNVYKIVDLFADGDQLVEIGSWTELDRSGKEINNGHYMSLFRKVNGKYLCFRDMNVSSKPAKPI